MSWIVLVEIDYDTIVEQYDTYESAKKEYDKEKIRKGIYSVVLAEVKEEK